MRASNIQPVQIDAQGQIEILVIDLLARSSSSLLAFLIYIRTKESRGNRVKLTKSGQKAKASWHLPKTFCCINGLVTVHFRSFKGFP